MRSAVLTGSETMTNFPADPAPSALERAARPLLRLASVMTGVESTFLTSIDWDSGRQKVLYSLNQGALEVEEGIEIDWHESMCRTMFLAGRVQSSEVGVEVSATQGAKSLGFRTFFAFPILAGDTAIGTVCGASRGEIVLDASQLEAMQLIADALLQLLEAERQYTRVRLRAEAAEHEAEQARSGLQRQALHSQHMEHLAHTDVLTGLPNRRAFMVRWEDELARSGRRQYPIALMLLDADEFKAVNDSEGHAKGDEVLRAIGATLMEVARSPDVVARLGGDEFALVTTHSDSPRLHAVAEDIRSRFARRAAELGVTTTLSVGMVSSEHCPREGMLADADRALYFSKDAGGDTARIYTCSSGQDVGAAAAR